MFAMTPDVQRAPEPMRASPEPRAYARRIDCCEGRARPESGTARGGAPQQAVAWEHTRRIHT
ncbi:MAG: hypothetical protein KY444_04350 [Gemmatimonadetes bacterium]|nr:hypothetical protein [Gemmatimonadota bacterium]